MLVQKQKVVHEKVQRILLVESLRRIGDNKASGNGSTAPRTVLAAVMNEWTALNDNFESVYREKVLAPAKATNVNR